MSVLSDVIGSRSRSSGLKLALMQRTEVPRTVCPVPQGVPWYGTRTAA